MVRLFHINLVFCCFVILIILFGCYSSEDNEETKNRKDTSSKISYSVFFDTLQYDDGNLYEHDDNIEPDDLLGVWFTPKRDQVCSLISVQYVLRDGLFSSLQVPFSVFVNLVPQYQHGGARLSTIGSQLVKFSDIKPPPGGGNQIIVEITMTNPIDVNDSLDFFIGWGSVGHGVPFPAALGDSGVCCEPPRSYLWSTQLDTMLPLDYDLGVRATFKYITSPPDSVCLTFELRWNKPNTDLDLYLIIPTTLDTIYWDNVENNVWAKLDVDNRHGYGPEKIMHPIVDSPPDSLAELAVHYYGPPNGKRVDKVWLIVYWNETPFDTLGPCQLEFEEWWDVASVNLNNGEIFQADSCNVTLKSNLSVLRKED